MSENSNNNIDISNFYAHKFAAFFFFFSILLFAAGYFTGTSSLDISSLIYAARQVLLPAAIMAGIGFIIGKFLDSANKKGKKRVRKNIKY